MKPPAVDFDDPGQLGQTKDLLVRKVADGDFAVEGHEVVFAHGEHFNILHNHHLIMVFIENSVVQNICT